MWPLLLIPFVFLLSEKKKPSVSEEIDAAEKLGPIHPCDWVLGGGGVSWEAEFPAVVEAYLALRNTPDASSGDWYYLAQLAESYGWTDAAECFHAVGEQKEQLGR